MSLKLRIKKGDKVEVICGKDKKKVGIVLESLIKPRKLLIKNINKVKKHLKITQKNPNGGIIEKESPINISNVLLFCNKCNKGVRHGYKMEEEKKIRFCKKCGNEL